MASPTKKQQIMEAAAQLFRDKGYSATSMRDLAQAVHLQASSLYNHISSKQEILCEICFSNAQRFNAGIIAVEEKYSSAKDRVQALIHLHLDVATQDFTSITAFNDEWRHLDEPELSKFRQMRKEYEGRFLAILEDGMTNGEFRRMDTTVTLYTILSSLRWVYDWYKPGKKLSAEDVEQTIIQLILQGLEE